MKIIAVVFALLLVAPILCASEESENASERIPTPTHTGKTYDGGNVPSWYDALIYIRDGIRSKWFGGNKKKKVEKQSK